MDRHRAEDGEDGWGVRRGDGDGVGDEGRDCRTSSLMWMPASTSRVAHDIGEIDSGMVVYDGK
jgi:hypothetical protein